VNMTAMPAPTTIGLLHVTTDTVGEEANTRRCVFGAGMPPRASPDVAWMPVRAAEPWPVVSANRNWLGFREARRRTHPGARQPRSRLGTRAGASYFTWRESETFVKPRS
jgi:hypothetical protein